MKKAESASAIRRMISVASGEEKADLVIKQARWLNVFTEEWEQGDIAIAQGRVAGIGRYQGEKELSFPSARIVPGFIDGHIHLESSLLSPAMFARCVFPHGTTAVICDPHEIANVMGTDGIEYMLQATEGLPLDAFVMLPSCVPATGEDESFAALSEAELEPFYAHPRVCGLAEMMNAPGVLMGDEAVLKKIAAAGRHGLPVDGHAPLLSGMGLQAYIAAGVNSDHECSSLDEAFEKLKFGQWIMIRQGTAAKNLSSLLPLLKRPYASRCLLVTDDKHPGELLCDGHMDGLVRLAVYCGADPILALKAASWNAAQAFRLRWRGAVAPGYTADMAVIDDDYNVLATVKDGRLAFSGEPFDVPEPPIDPRLARNARHSFHMEPIRAERFAGEGSLAVLRMVGGQILTLNGGRADNIDTENDILKIAVLERHRNTGHVGVGYLSGYGLKHGAIATSVAHDSHNIIVVGADERDMACAAERIRVLQGGIALADGQRVIGELPLPIAGLMSEHDARTVNDGLEALRAAAESMGVSPEIDPFMTLSFMSLPVIPEVRILTRGVFDVTNRRYI